MPTCAGVAFKRVSRSYWFTTGGLELREQQMVVAHTQRGLELGTVRVAPREVPSDELQAPLRSITRLATDDDQREDARNRENALTLLEDCRELASKYSLQMRLLHAEFSLDRSHLTFYFAAETRVDFRDLVRQMAARAGASVLFYQIGARDQARIIGGVGTCGRALCCSSFLTDFESVSVRTAKEQSLFQNPVRFAGVCGKLMCCLRYEQDSYTEGHDRLPALGSIISSSLGEGVVIDVNVPNGGVTVQFSETGTTSTLQLSEIEVLRGSSCNSCKRQHGFGANAETDQLNIEESL